MQNHNEKLLVAAVCCNIKEGNVKGIYWLKRTENI